MSAQATVIKSEVSGYRLLFGYLGIFINMVGVILLLPLLAIPFYFGELKYAWYFIVPSVLALIIGTTLNFTLIRGRTRIRLKRHQDAILMLLIWVVSIVFGSIPFLLSREYTFIESLFEATSGFTTAGLSVIDVTNLPHILLFFRSVLHLVGGIGLVLIFTSTISNHFNMKLYSAEGHTDRLMPNLVKSARLILFIYLGYIILGTIAYMICGMNGFDAINHAISALSTGGFSTKTNSIGEFNSLSIEIITMVLMLLGSTSFLIHLYIIKGKFKKAFNHAELKFLPILAIVFIPLLINSIMSFSNFGFTLGESFRHGIFYFISSMTTTGFTTTVLPIDLPSQFTFYLIIVMLIGGGLGSTSGGIKQMRFIIWMKSLYWNIRNRLSHKRTIRTNYITRLDHKDIVTPEEINENNSFVGTFMIVLIVGAIAFTLLGATFDDALFDFASSLSCTGLSSGFISQASHPLVLLISMVGMLFGRLDLIIVFIAMGKFASDVSRKRIM